MNPQSTSSVWSDPTRVISRPCSAGAFQPIGVVLVAGLLLAGCHENTSPVDTLTVAAISVDGGARFVERGSDPLLTATVRGTAGDTVKIPVAWRSSNGAVATIDRTGRLVTHDTGSTSVRASALGVTSQPVEMRVVLLGATTVAPYQFQPPVSVTPGGPVGDSIRLLVTSASGGPAVGATVIFRVSEGGGTVSPGAVTVGPSGLAATRWVTGPAAGGNSVIATVVGKDSAAITFVKGNPAQFTVTTYAALSVLRGDAQTGRVLSPLPVVPAVRLVDPSGRPRPGIPITFRPSTNGRVTNVTVSTGADGVASPGTWTLGDEAGDQQLVVTVEGAMSTLHASATGGVTRFSAATVATAQAATCALGADHLVRCLGQWPQNGSGDTAATRASPTPTKNAVHFISVAGGAAHFCGIATDASVYCWGVNASRDTSGAAISNGTPIRVKSALIWQQVAPGGQHNCALTSDQTAYCWGSDADGQLGDNLSATRYAPAPVEGGFHFTSIASGGAHSCGIAPDGSAFCWGSNAGGQLGDGTFSTRRTPTAVTGGIEWRTLGGGMGSTCGLAADGTAYCWGANTGRVVPESYPGAPAFTSLSVGAAHQCALTAAGVAYCWGSNSSGQLGDSTTVSRSSPTPVALMLRFKSISAGTEHTCGVTVEGYVACWGRNQSGELGVDGPIIQLTPRYIVLGTTP